MSQRAGKCPPSEASKAAASQQKPLNTPALKLDAHRLSEARSVVD